MAGQSHLPKESVGTKIVSQDQAGAKPSDVERIVLVR
jgi:hypothetical protein